MSKENNKVVEIENEEVTTEETVQETKFAKVGNTVKKHGKTALKVLGIGALTLAAFALGKRSADGCSDDEYEYEYEDDETESCDDDVE